MRPNNAITILLCCSWMYKVDQLDFHLPPKIDTTLFKPHCSWSLVDTAVVYGIEYQYATARFVLYITRKPFYFLYILVLPCILLSVLMLLVFLLPPESGEKVSLQITVLLSFTVFQLVSNDNMSHSSDYAPLMGELL